MKTIRPMLLLLATLMLSSVAPVAYASAPTTVTGTLTYPPITVLDIHFANGNTLITATAPVLFAGDISGTFNGVQHFVIHADGSGNFQGSGTFTGSMGSATGTFSSSFSGTINSDGTDQGRFVITQGTGGLAGIHGVGAFHTPSPNPGFDVYSGKVHFGPS